jgi:SAM-dependent methyltransferase
MSNYAFSVDDQDAERVQASYAHHLALAQADDTRTLGRILARFPAGLQGMRVWVPGCGNGNLARELTHYVGPTGQVVATDIDISRFGQQEDVEVLRHDVVNDPPPPGRFNLVHARRLLSHLQEREDVLLTMVGCLEPDGHLGLEDWAHPDDPRDMVPLVPEPAEENRDAYCDFQAAVWRILAERGHDPHFGWDTLEYLDAFGLVELEAGSESTLWRGGGPGCRLQTATLTELDSQLTEHGVSDDTKLIVRQLLTDPAFVLRSPPMCWTWGRKPRRSTAA